MNEYVKCRSCFSLLKHTVLLLSLRLSLLPFLCVPSSHPIFYELRAPFYFNDTISNAEHRLDANLSTRPGVSVNFSEISKALEESTGVQLIGYDLLRRESDGKLVLVDFNYFPCFRQTENLPDKIADFIKEKAKITQ